jgi:hypothetical protein
MLKNTFIAALVLSISVSAYAGEGMVTPYGDYCSKCTTYGTCKAPLPPIEAIAAIEQYYMDRGYKVGYVRHKGRFIEAEIYDKKKLVDKVLFDRRTGRIRSVL